MFVKKNNKNNSGREIIENKEKTEVYEGKEAEEYIEKMKIENKDFIISIDEN